ncbi:MAG: hypothetical protein J5I65_06245 [Aridibacter famidurans]|nr:hypothetical protein [Aridibacter famidurans]
MNDDWYRRKTWTETDQEEFFARLKRSRGQFHKAQYLRIQAGYLEEVEPSASLELLQRVVSEFPEPSELAQTHLQMAHCYALLSEPDEAVRSFRKALAQEEELTSVETQAYLDFPMFVVLGNLTELFSEVQDVLARHSSRLMFPLDHFQYNMCLAFILEHNGDKAGAAQHARAALAAASKEHSGFRYHPNVGLVIKQDEVIRRKLEALADGQQRN